MEPSSYKTITFYFLTTTCRSYFFSKVAGENYPRGHMTSFRQRYNVYNFIYKLYPSIQLHIASLSAWKRLCLSQGIQHYKTINSVKSIFLGFSAMVSNSYHVENVLENTYFVFYILYNTFQRLILVDTTYKKVFAFYLLGFGMYSSIKQKVKKKFF